MSQKLLDDLTKLAKKDSKGLLGSIQKLHLQFAQIFNESSYIKFPSKYKKAKNIVVVGMGGSTLGSYLLKPLFSQQMKIPMDVINDYKVSGSVNSRTLVIASSYSGTTEETITVAKEAKKRNAMVICLASGGSLAIWAKKNRIPLITFKAVNNPCGQPRMGLGYTAGAQLLILNNLGYIKLSQKMQKHIVSTIAYYDTLFGVLTPHKDNIAKKTAMLLLEKCAIFVSSEHISGCIHVASNQMNETSKRFAAFFTIPELNHHLLEGMAKPASNKKALFFIMFNSSLYNKRNQKRYQITKEVLNKNGIQSLMYNCLEKDAIGQACELLVFNSYLSYYSAMLENIDPNPVPFVDYFKARMKK
ncbi:MAG: SIS domain-containing protein [bacterium]